MEIFAKKRYIYYNLYDNLIVFMAQNIQEQLSGRTETLQQAPALHDTFEEQKWFQELPDNKKQEVTRLFDEIKTLEEQLQTLDASQKYAGNAAKVLWEHISKDPHIQSDPSGQVTLKLYERYKQEFETALAQKKPIEEEIGRLKQKIEAIKHGLESMQKESAAQVE